MFCKQYCNNQYKTKFLGIIVILLATGWIRWKTKMLIHDGEWLTAEIIHSMLQLSVHIAISEERLKKSNQIEKALMALTLMMLPLIVLAVEKNICYYATEQKLQWTWQSSNHGSSTLNYDWLKKRLEGYTDLSERALSLSLWSFFLLKTIAGWKKHQKGSSRLHCDSALIYLARVII